MVSRSQVKRNRRGQPVSSWSRSVAVILDVVNKKRYHDAYEDGNYQDCDSNRDTEQEDSLQVMLVANSFE